jgi:hypothetical protein
MSIHSGGKTGVNDVTLRYGSRGRMIYMPMNRLAGFHETVV